MRQASCVWITKAHSHRIYSVIVWESRTRRVPVAHAVKAIHIIDLPWYCTACLDHISMMITNEDLIKFGIMKILTVFIEGTKNVDIYSTIHLYSRLALVFPPFLDRPSESSAYVRVYCLHNDFRKVKGFYVFEWENNIYVALLSPITYSTHTVVNLINVSY